MQLARTEIVYIPGGRNIVGLLNACQTYGYMYTACSAKRATCMVSVIVFADVAIILSVLTGSQYNYYTTLSILRLELPINLIYLGLLIPG